MNNKPDFYLTCYELDMPFEKRQCYFKKQIAAFDRDDFMLIKIIPPLSGFYGNEDVEELVIATRYEGNTLFPINEWPMHVYACKIKSNLIKESAEAKADDLEILFWGELHQT